MENKNIIYKIIDLENFIIRNSHVNKNKNAIFKLLRENINKYLDNPQCIYTKNYLNLYTRKENNLNDYYKLMFENLSKKDRKYELVIIINIGSFANLNYIKSKIDIFKQMFMSNKILLLITIVEEIYFQVIKQDYFADFEKNLISLKVKNKGCDIGPFYLSLDYLIKNNINYDHILKLHTKSDLNWLIKMTPFLSSKFFFQNIMEYIKKSNIQIYGTNKMYLDYRNLLCMEYILNTHKEGLLEELISNHRVSFIAGTVFIISKKLIDFVLKLVPLENYIFFEEIYSSNHSIYEQSIIHTLERLFCVAEFIMKHDEKLSRNCEINQNINQKLLKYN